MSRTRLVGLLVAAATVFPVTGAYGSQPVIGKSLLVKDRLAQPAKRSLKVNLADVAIVVPGFGSSADPTIAGATLSLSNPVTREAAIVRLPSAGWEALGDPLESAGYKYKDAKLVHGPCKSATLKPGSLRANCRGSGIGFSLDEAVAPSLAVTVRFGAGDTVCAEFGGAAVTKYVSTASGAAIFKAREAPAPSACPLTGAPDVATLVVLGDSLSTGQAGECAGGACPRSYELLHAALEARLGHTIDLVHGATGAGHVSDVLTQVDDLPVLLAGPVAVTVTAGGGNLLNASTEPEFPGDVASEREQMGNEIDDVLDALLVPDRFGAGVMVSVFWANVHDPGDGDAEAPPGIGGFQIGSEHIADFSAEIDQRTTPRAQLVDAYGRFFGHGLCAGGAGPSPGSWLVGDCIHLNATGELQLADVFLLEIAGP